MFWPLLVVVTLIWTRTIVSRDGRSAAQVLALRWTVVGLGFLSYILECLGSEPDPRPSNKAMEENPILTANMYSIWVMPSHPFLFLVLIFTNFVDIRMDDAAHEERSE